MVWARLLLIQQMDEAGCQRIKGSVEQEDTQTHSGIQVVNSDQAARNKAVAERSAGAEASKAAGRGAGGEAGWDPGPERQGDRSVFASCPFWVIVSNSEQAALCRNLPGLLWDEPPAARIHGGGVLQYLWTSDTCPLELQEARAHSGWTKAV